MVTWLANGRSVCETQKNKCGNTILSQYACGSWWGTSWGHTTQYIVDALFTNPRNIVNTHFPIPTRPCCINCASCARPAVSAVPAAPSVAVAIDTCVRLSNQLCQLCQPRRRHRPPAAPAVPGQLCQLCHFWMSFLCPSLGMHLCSSRLSFVCSPLGVYTQWVIGPPPDELYITLHHQLRKTCQQHQFHVNDYTLPCQCALP